MNVVHQSAEVGIKCVLFLRSCRPCSLTHRTCPQETLASVGATFAHHYLKELADRTCTLNRSNRKSDEIHSSIPSPTSDSALAFPRSTMPLPSLRLFTAFLKLSDSALSFTQILTLVLAPVRWIPAYSSSQLITLSVCRPHSTGSSHPGLSCVQSCLL